MNRFYAGSQSAIPSGFYFKIEGEQACNSTWQDNIYFFEAGTPMVLTGLSFKMSFWSGDGWCNQGPTLSTDDGTLSVQVDPDSGIANILYINTPALNMAGDYRCDLASEDINGVVTPWASGVITFAPNSISF